MMSSNIRNNSNEMNIKSSSFKLNSFGSIFSKGKINASTTIQIWNKANDICFAKATSLLKRTNDNSFTLLILLILFIINVHKLAKTEKFNQITQTTSQKNEQHEYSSRELVST